MAKKFNIKVICYENLLTKPYENFRVAVETLDLSFVPNTNITRKPSQQTIFEKQGFIFDEKHLNGWKTYLNTTQLNYIRNVLEKFEVSIYDIDNFMPYRNNK